MLQEPNKISHWCSGNIDISWCDYDFHAISIHIYSARAFYSACAMFACYTAQTNSSKVINY